MRSLIPALATVLLAGCAAKQPGAYEVSAAATDGANDAATALKDHADTLWDLRADQAKLGEALTKYEAALAADPTNRDVAVRITRGWYFHGDAYQSEKADKLADWEKAIAAGKGCLALNEEFTALLAKGDETEATAARAFTVEDVPCIYWTASALGKWAKLKGLSTTLKHIGTAKAYIARVEELDPDYFYRAADRYWGAYWAGIPSFAGQDLDKSKAHFEKSIEAAPNYLGTRVLLADYWAVKTQDRAAFTEALEAVIAADPQADPDIVAENMAEQAKAKALLANVDDLFAE